MFRACHVTWLLLLLILKMGALDVHVGFIVGCHEAEREALLKFKRSLNDIKNLLSSWKGKDCCRWEGVSCDNVTFYVSHLNVQGQYYDPDDYGEASSITSSKLDRSLAELSHLKYLELSGTDFQSSPIPGFIGSFKHLRYLDLSNSNFGGVVPSQLANLTRLHTLDLSSNQLEGPLPHVLANMTSVTNLSLSSNSFNGSIPLGIQNMRKLQNLDLSKNKFSQVEGGAIMGILGNLCKLISFDFSENSIGGEIGAHHNLSKCATFDLETLKLGGGNKIGGTLPSWLGDFKSLRVLDICDNAMEGPIPVSIESLSYLEDLHLSSNNLTGTLPNSLGGMIKLRLLDVANNSISGEIPTSVGKLSSLKVLELSQNSLNGTIPEGLGQCKALYYIRLSHNNLHGVVSESFFTNLSNLKILDLSSNLLEVNLGSNWSPPFQLERLKLRSCKMQTQFPQWIGNQTRLFELDLSDNMMSGKLNSLFRLGNLVEVNISHNQLTGPVPYFSSSIFFIDLSYNLFSGPLVHDDPSAKNDTVGTSVCQLPDLVFLDLQRNNIIGTIPDCWGNSFCLEYINLSNNNLSGIIPMSLGQRLNLQFVKLSNNSLQGPIPPTLSSISSLKILDLRANKLSGNIPIIWGAKTDPVLQILILRGNRLVGVIPTTLCYLPKLHFIDLAHNNLTGGVPRCFGSNLMGMKWSPSEYDKDYINQTEDYVYPLDDSTAVVLKGAVLQYTTTLKYVVNLDLSCNALVGSIPHEITNLSSLIGLNLSHNHLTGIIPKKIGKLTSLESLDLSNNNLSGTIPSSISDLTWLTSINLSNNKLHGQIPTGNQLQTLTDPSSYEGNPGLCGDPLPYKCKTSQGRNQQQQEQEKHDKEDDLENPLFYFVIISGVATGFWGVVGSLLLKNRFRFALFQLVGKVADYLYVQVMVRLNRFRN